MKECTICHAMSDDSAGRCSGCGRPFLFGQVKQKQCPSCQRGNPQYAEKCVYCGSPLN